MSDQLTIYDQAERIKQQGMEAAYQYADVDWRRIASEAVRECALTMPEFTPDDVWEIIFKSGITTHENRAFGSIMQSAARAGMIKKTGRYIESRRKNQHKAPLTQWMSLIYRAARNQGT